MSDEKNYSLKGQKEDLEQNLGERKLKSIGWKRVSGTEMRKLKVFIRSFYLGKGPFSNSVLGLLQIQVNKVTWGDSEGRWE